MKKITAVNTKPKNWLPSDDEAKAITAYRQALYRATRQEISIAKAREALVIIGSEIECKRLSAEHEQAAKVEQQ